MARICRTCGRAKTEEEHDIAQVVTGIKDGEPEFGPAPKGWPNRWVCKTRLVATSPVSGKLFPVDHPQRRKGLDVRHVHESRFEGDLKP
jgi:hypothetical protein